MKVSFLQVAALACLGTQALATPLAEPVATNTLHERGWDPVSWWYSFWEWVHEHQGHSDGSTICKNPLMRKEWRQLSATEKKNYISAVQCLASRPAITTAVIAGAVSRFDDFQGVHSRQTPDIHWVGHFAIWHRLMMAYYEKALREECGYDGAQPYWDWLIDTESGLNMTQWPIFDPDTGFGGDGPFIATTDDENPLGIEGREGGGCVQDGPFAEGNFSLSLGPSVNYTISNPHCLTRDFAPSIAATNLIQEVWDEVMEQPNYGAFARRLEALPSWAETNVHGGGHFSVGGVLGTMGDAYNSPGDPVFYLHHTNLDRLFWSWQQEDLETRLSDVSGPIIPFDYNNTAGGNVTLDFEINLYPLTGNFTLGELLDTEGDVLCYTYE